MKGLFLGIVIIVCYTSLSGQTDTTLTLDEVVVHSNRIEQDISESGRDITVISRDELLSSGVRSLDEAVQMLAGVEVQTRGPYGSQGDIVMRGGTFNQVLVLIDGQPINDPLTGHFNSNIPVTFSDVKQIEVLRGPSSAIYGPDAVGGVINIVTQINDQTKHGVRLKGAYGFGGYGLQKWNVAGVADVSDWKIGAAWDKSKADGPEHEGDSTSRYIDIQTLSGFVSYDGGPLSASIRVSRDMRDFDARYFYTRSTFDRSTEEVNRLWGQAMLKYELTKTQNLRFNASYGLTSDEFYFTPTSSPNEHTTSRSDYRLEWQGIWSSEFTTLIGVNINAQDIESNDRGDHEEGRQGAFIMGEYKPITGLTLTPAVRLDLADQYDLQVNPQLALSYNQNIWGVRAFGGRSIRAADFTERYVNFGRVDTLADGRNLGNAELLPETSWNFEVGGDVQLTNNLSFATTAFIRKSENLIDYVLTPTEEIEDARLLSARGNYFYARNVGETSTIGVESRLDYKYDIDKNWNLQVGLSHTWIDTQSDEDELSKYLASHANHLVTWQFGLRRRGIGLRISGLYKKRNQDLAPAISAELMDSYHVMNTRLTANVLGDLLKVYAQVDNMFDTEYSDILGARLPGQWWSFGLLLNWN